MVKINSIKVELSSLLPQALEGAWIDVTATFYFEQLKPPEDTKITANIILNGNYVHTEEIYLPYYATSSEYTFLSCLQLVNGVNTIKIVAGGVESNTLTINAKPNPPDVEVTKCEYNVRRWEDKPGVMIISISGTVYINKAPDPANYNGVFVQLKYMVNGEEYVGLFRRLPANVRQVWIGYPSTSKSFSLSFQKPVGDYMVEVIAYMVKPNSISTPTEYPSESPPIQEVASSVASGGETTVPQPAYITEQPNLVTQPTPPPTPVTTVISQETATQQNIQYAQQTGIITTYSEKVSIAGITIPWWAVGLGIGAVTLIALISYFRKKKGEK